MKHLLGVSLPFSMTLIRPDHSGATLQRVRDVSVWEGRGSRASDGRTGLPCDPREFSGGMRVEADWGAYQVVAR